MIDREKFLSLVPQSEGPTLDFKATSYNLHEDGGKVSFVKDVLCMANTPREGTSFIVLGVKKYPDGTYELIGVESHPDDADLQSQLSARVRPVPEFVYHSVQHEGKSYGIIEISPVRQGPCMPTKDFGKMLRTGIVYFRRGSQNDEATAEDLRRIVRWIEEGTVSSMARLDDIPEWERFLAAVHGFETKRRYVLISAPLRNGKMADVSVLGRVPWCAVFDFDPGSESEGLLSRARTEMERTRRCQIVVARENPTLYPDRVTHWFFACGLEGREETLTTKEWREWKTQFGSELDQQFGRIAGAVAPAPVTGLVLWYDEMTVQYLRSCIEAALSAFGSSLELVMLTDEPAMLRGLKADYDAQLFEIPLHHLCSGLELELATPSVSDLDEYLLPSSSGAPISLDLQERQWLSEELQIVDLSSGYEDSEDGDSGGDFLRGAEVSWHALSNKYDVDRDKTQRIRRRVEAELQNKQIVRVNLYHAPGAGATTVARRVVWDLHQTYPCALLSRSEPEETAERLYRLSSLTGQAVLLLIDGAQVAEREVDELYDHVRSRHIPVVFLQTLRRFKRQQEGNRVFYLPAELSGEECYRFVEAFSREEPSKRARLEALMSAEEPRMRTAFYFGLETFGREFRGLENYVNARVAELTPEQRRVMMYLALAHHYAQQPTPAQAFADLLGMPKSRTVELQEALTQGALELLAQVQDGVWRTAHELLALEILKQVLLPGPGDRRQWRQGLSACAIRFAEFCRGTEPVPSEEMLEIARRTFIYRDNAELLGTERSAQSSFSQLIEEIPVREGRLEVLRKLVRLYPTEAHIGAHLGRFYAIEMKDYDEAIVCIDQALQVQEHDHLLHHMKGMAMRSQMYELLRQKGDLDQAVRLAKSASHSFETARELSADDEHAYISEIQMRIALLDYAGAAHDGDVNKYIASPNADPYIVESFDKAEELLALVSRNREGQGPSRYEQDSRAKLDTLYGEYYRALGVWDSLLARRDAYHPPVRRQIVWTYLARRGRSWDALPEKEIDRIVELLEANLNEEPYDDRNVRMWVQAVRRSKRAPSIDAIIERVAYWKSNSETLDAAYYLYVCHALKALQGSSLAREEARRYIEESRDMARLRRSRTKSLEWLGKGSGIQRLVHHSELGEWDREKNFWERTGYLERVRGRIAGIKGPQAGQIEVEGGLIAFFVPAHGGYARGRSENKLVDFYLGFSYDGLRAWEVADGQD